MIPDATDAIEPTAARDVAMNIIPLRHDCVEGRKSMPQVIAIPICIG